MEKMPQHKKEDGVQETPVILTKRQTRYLKVKRALDFACSLAGILVLLPVMALVALAIKLDSPREKVLFRQQRVGQHGKLFWLYKFRSMKQDAPELSCAEFSDAECYITRVGRFIRKTSLDELPQLWNCLLGQMSLVGPRPLLKREVKMHIVRGSYGVYQVKPGITGLAQINGRDAVRDDDKALWDRTYVQHLSFAQDVDILWQTGRKVLRQEGILDEAASKLTPPDRFVPADPCGEIAN